MVLKQVLVTAAVIIKTGQILLAQRLPEAFEGNKWEFPGGKVEPGEDPRAGLRRELKEELGLEVKVGRVLEVCAENFETRQLVLLYFEVKIVQGVPEPIDCQAVAWLEPEQVENLVMPKLDRQFWESFKGNKDKKLF